MRSKKGQGEILWFSLLIVFLERTPALTSAQRPQQRRTVPSVCAAVLLTRARMTTKIGENRRPLRFVRSWGKL